MELSADNKLINGFWISPNGKPLSALERLCIYSFCANGHDFRLWTYGELKNVPQDTIGGRVEVCDAREILPPHKTLINKGRLAHFSDWFRWALMYKQGGWYVDMDVVCLRPFQFEEEMVFSKETDKNMNSGLLKCPAGHFLAEKMIEASAHPDRIMPWDKGRYIWRKYKRRARFWRNSHTLLSLGELSGPVGLTRAAYYYGLEHHAVPFWYFEPIPWINFQETTDDSLHQREMLTPLLAHSFAIHMYHSMWAGMDTNGEFHPNSPFEVLKQRYLPERVKKD